MMEVDGEVMGLVRKLFMVAPGNGEKKRRDGFCSPAAKTPNIHSAASYWRRLQSRVKLKKKRTRVMCKKALGFLAQTRRSFLKDD